MLHSAQNFAVGFFGYPIEGQYLQSITYEDRGVRLHTLSSNLFAYGGFVILDQQHSGAIHDVRTQTFGEQKAELKLTFFSHFTDARTPISGK